MTLFGCRVGGDVGQLMRHEDWLRAIHNAISPLYKVGLARDRTANFMVPTFRMSTSPSIGRFQICLLSLDLALDSLNQAFKKLLNKVFDREEGRVH